MNFFGKRILLGVSGSIAAYKAADLCSQLGKLGADVHVILTPHAAKFVGVATFRALSRNPVLVDVFDEPMAARISHIDVAQSAHLILVAPASANIIAKLALGIADDMLSTCLLAAPPTTPLLVAPAMNTVMWESPATRANVATVVRRGAQIIEPGTGMLACQDVGEGKLADVEIIVAEVIRAFERTHDFEGVEFVVTAGATREPLDPVRYLSNRSSGRMGYAIAEEAQRRGAKVTLISGPSNLSPCRGVHFIEVETAAEMLAASLNVADKYVVFVGAAAVADYTPEQVSEQKLKRTSDKSNPRDTGLEIRLRPTQDIVATIGARKRLDQLVVGFAAETENLIENARRKLVSKCADLIVANDVTMEGAGFDVETNIVTLVTPHSEQALPIMRKRDVASRLLDAIAGLRADRLNSAVAGTEK